MDGRKEKERPYDAPFSLWEAAKVETTMITRAEDGADRANRGVTVFSHGQTREKCPCVHDVALGTWAGA